MPSSYLVSVITPFHNVEESMFLNCVDSMLHQTIGFEHIEWIVVLHNCTDESITFAQQLLQGYDNVRLPILNNAVYSPSSPRNHGLSLATAPYVGFLDGDDSYHPNCLEVAVREIRETSSQVITFRRDYELEKESLQVLSEQVIWNQTEWRIVMDRNHWEEDKMFCGLWGFVTSRLIDRSFLEQHHIRFAEDILWAEDFMFIATCYVNAQRIAFLPQHIGYHYFINSNSLIQNNKKSPDILKTYFRGVHRIFDMLQSYGIDINDFAQLCYSFLAGYLLHSDLTLAVRCEIRDMCLPYVQDLHRLPSCKLYSPEHIEMTFRLSREVILHPQDPSESRYLKELDNGWMKLMEILRVNRDTDYGKAHSFDHATSMRAFAYRVPLTSHSSYSHLIALQTRIGETGILTAEPIERYFVCPDGYLLPNTERHFRFYMEAFATTLSGRHNLLIGAAQSTHQSTNDRATIDTMESMMIKDYMSRYLYARGSRRADFSAPDSFFFQTDQQEYLTRALFYALADPHIDQMVAMTTRAILAFFQCMQERWQELIPELRQCDPARTTEVEAILAEGFDQPVASRLWPELSRIVAFGAGELYEYTLHMKAYTGDVPYNHGYYYTEEGIYGKAIADDCNLFEFVSTDCFFEFLPFAESDEEPRLLTDLEVGVPYQLVITNHAGLYRFVTDHIICLKEHRDGTPLFTIY